MSSLDSQVLSISDMFAQDVVRYYRQSRTLNEREQVLWGRLFVFFIFAITYVLSLITAQSIFSLTIWFFTGFTVLFLVVVAAIFWKRSTREGALASVITVTALWSYFFFQGWQIRDYTVGMTGAMPVAVILAAPTAAIVIVSLLTKPTGEKTIAQFF